MSASPRRSAFTLVELMVVIGTVALLIGLLLPTVGQARRAGRQVQCLSSLHQLAIVDQMYQADFGRYHLPHFWGWSPSAPGWDVNTPPAIPASGPYQSWANLPSVWRTLGDGTHSGRFYHRILCPDAPLAQADGNDRVGYAVGLSYGANNSQLPGYAAALAPDYVNVWRTGQVRSPAEKIQFVDAIGSVGVGGSFNSTMRYYTSGWGEVHGPPDRSNIVAYRHHGGACAVYFDGHAAWSAAATLIYDPAVSSTASHRRQWRPTDP